MCPGHPLFSFPLQQDANTVATLEGTHSVFILEPPSTQQFRSSWETLREGGLLGGGGTTAAPGSCLRRSPVRVCRTLCRPFLWSPFWKCLWVSDRDTGDLFQTRSAVLLWKQLHTRARNPPNAAGQEALLGVSPSSDAASLEWGISKPEHENGNPTGGRFQRSLGLLLGSFPTAGASSWRP